MTLLSGVSLQEFEVERPQSRRTSINPLCTIVRVKVHLN